MSIKFLKKYKDVTLPTRATKQSAGLDIYAYIKEGETLLKKGKITFVNTGLALVLPTTDSVGLVYARSGLACKNGICLANGTGVIDSDYTGEIKIALINLGEDDYIIKNGDRVAQLVVTKVYLGEVKEVDFINETERGENGFGSTGIG
ncbi:MAG: dUTP diphosphatase [Oscillospiraceae bacterium]